MAKVAANRIALSGSSKHARASFVTQQERERERES